jgi:hypothetical protein
LQTPGETKAGVQHIGPADKSTFVVRGSFLVVAKRLECRSEIPKRLG